MARADARSVKLQSQATAGQIAGLKLHLWLTHLRACVHLVCVCVCAYISQDDRMCRQEQKQFLGV